MYVCMYVCMYVLIRELQRCGVSIVIIIICARVTAPTGMLLPLIAFIYIRT